MPVFSYSPGTNSQSSTQSGPIGSSGYGVPLRGYEPIITVTATKTLAIADSGTVQNCTNSTAAVITIPLNSAEPFPIGARIIIRKTTSQTVTIAPAGGVTVLNSSGATLTATDVVSVVILRKTGTDSWIAFLDGITVPIAGSMVNPSGVSVVDFSIPAGVRRLTLLSSGLHVPSGTIVRLGTSSGVLTSGYNGVTHYIGPSANYPFAGAGVSSTVGFTIPQCGGGSGGNDSFCMTFYRLSPNAWNAAGQSKDNDYTEIASGNIQLPGELTTFRYISPSSINSGSLQLLWEY